MSISGTALFADDIAWDVRSCYLQFVGDGLSGPEATKQLIREWSDVLDDANVSCPFWLALAATQWKCGRLEPQVLQSALKVIDSGADLARWNVGSRDQKKREVVLQKLRVQLTSPQPREKRIPKRFRDFNEWQPGDLVAYRLLSGRFIILHVIGHHTNRGGTSPVCELLDWVGRKLPDESQPLTRVVRIGGKGYPVTKFIIGRIKAKERPDDRIQHLGINLKSSQELLPCTVSRWSWLDDQLKEWFGLE